ncbi:MAG: hypothetical protein RR135_01725 [Oscillospiraceae bacterium]
MEQRTLRLLLLKNILYTFLLLVCYIAQETPDLLTLWGICPLPVIGVITAIAMVEGEFSGGLFGLLGGILCDTAAFHIFGVASIFFLVLGTGIGLLIICLVQPNIKSSFLLTGVFAFIYGLACHYLLYGLWGYEGSAILLLRQTLPSALLTALWGVALFWMVRAIRRSFSRWQE